MNRRSFRMVVPLVVALSVLTSACFQIRFFRLDPAALADNEQGVIRLKLYQVSAGGAITDTFPFLLIGWDDGDLQLDGTRTWDNEGNFGGPFDKTKDNDLRDALLTAGNCEANGIDASTITGMTKWRVYRTTVTVDTTTGAPDDSFKVDVRFTRLFNDNTDRGDFVIFSGSWTDWLNPNGVPEVGELFCNGMVFASYSSNAP